MVKDKNLPIFFILIFLLNLSFQSNINLEKNIINNYYTSSLHEISSYQNFDEFYEGNLNNTTSNITLNYIFNRTKKDEQIFFDYQSEFGCLHISFNQGKEVERCAKDKNNFFSLNISNYTDQNVNENITMNITIYYNSLNFDKDFNFDFSIKVSLIKSFSILKINSEHKFLCQMEKIEPEKFRCLFVIVNNKTNDVKEDNRSLIIFPIINENPDILDISAEYINKTIYDGLFNESSKDLIPNESSPYRNKINDTYLSFLRIPNVNDSQYIYVSIISTKGFLLEILSQKISENKTAYSFGKNGNKIQLFSINSKTDITLYFDNDDFSNNFLLLTTIQGKSTINMDYDTNTKYTIDEIENNLFLYIDSQKYNSNTNSLKFDKLDENLIFYLSYYKKENNKMFELIDGKSSRFSLNEISFPILFYEHIQTTSDNISINVNLQLYKCDSIKAIDDTFKVEALFLSQEDIQKIKGNNSYINEFLNRTKGELNPVTLAANIYLQDIITENNSYLLIILSSNFNTINNMILGTSISLKNSLKYPAERIYHFGEMNKNNRIIYRLKGNKKYNLMRLEFGQNCEDVKWSVKRTNENDYKKYKNNDTELSFVTEYWSNGRELLTMYIERGEDIFLTIFTDSIPKDNLKRTYAFKYINSGSNENFKNYVIKDDLLKYDIEERTIKINKNLKRSPPSNSIVKYYMKIIHENDYIKNENLKSISIIESNSTLLTNGSMEGDDIVYYVKPQIDKYQNYKANCYITIIENYNDIELLAYNYSSIDALQVDEPSKGLIIASISLTGISFLIFWIRLFHHCCCVEDFSYYNKKKTGLNYLI